MSDFFHQLDLDIFFTINSAHNPILDTLMWLVSGRLTWIPLYLVFIWLLVKRYKKDIWIVLLYVALMILVSDQLCNLVKNSVLRLRPSHEPGLSAMIHSVKTYTGGMYGFYSAHASNAFAVGVFMILAGCIRSRILSGLVILWAALISYSRIYLGVHYPSDVLAGMIIGTAIAAIMAILLNKTLQLKLRKKAVSD